MLTDAERELGALGLTAMATRLRAWLDDPANQRRSQTDCVLALARAHGEATGNDRARRLFARAQLPTQAAVADVWTGTGRGLSADVLANLATCDWVRRGHTVVLTGPSRAGKTFLAAALAREAALSGMRVEYVRVPEWLARYDTEASPTLRRLFQRLANAPLLVLDDFATERASGMQSHLLRRLVDARARQGRAILVAAPAPVEDWDGFFEDPTAAEALYGRLLDKAHVLNLKPQSKTARPLPRQARARRTRDGSA